MAVSAHKDSPALEAAARFRFSSEILRRLGEELNPHADQGILELVKNAYDADARRCSVELRNIDTPGGTIVVTDDGVGMDAETIRNAWLVLGRSSKNLKQRTTLGRVPAGSKGLGRLAALRLGELAVVRSWPRSDPAHVYTLEIDWRLFDRSTVVEDVPLMISRTPRSAAEQKKQGTAIRLLQLRDAVVRVEAKRLARALVLLSDPFGDDPEGFRPELVTDDPRFKELSALVAEKYFDAANFQVHASIDAEGQASAVFRYRTPTGWGNQKAAHADLSPKHARYQCPPVNFDFWTFLKSKRLGDGKIGLRKSIKDWIDSFGGVHIYENGLRVQPYGDEGDDWLGINLRRSQLSELRPSTNNSIGRISVKNESGDLIQKTDRAGYVQNDAFLAMRRFANDVLDWMAGRRRALRDAARQQEKKAAAQEVETKRAQLALEIEKAGAEARRALEDYDRSRERELDALRKDLQLYRTLATAGIMSAVFHHEARGGAQKTITSSIKTIGCAVSRKLGARDPDVLHDPADRLDDLRPRVMVPLSSDREHHQLRPHACVVGPPPPATPPPAISPNAMRALDALGSAYPMLDSSVDLSRVRSLNS